MTNKPIDLNNATLNKYVESLRPEDLAIRKKLDFGYSYDGTVALLYEIRPIWSDPSKIQHLEYAKIRYYKTKQEWNLYWKRASGKWELYEPFPRSSHLNEILKIIQEDKVGCFFG